MLPIMTLRGAAVWIVLALALAGCGERRAPRAATPSVPSAAPTPPAPERLPQARGCVSEGAPFPVARSRLAMARRSIVTGDRRVLDPLVFSPRGGRCARPLIVFSHGHHGEPRTCLRLCTVLARAGFIVVALRHEDRAVDGYGLQAGERVDDVEWLLDHLDARYDRRRIGIAGHSFGGITAGEAASQDSRLRAVLSMAGTASHGTMAATRAPTLLIAGTRDPIETVDSSRAAADAIPATVPHELVVVEGARHGQLLSLCAQIGSCAEVERRAKAFFERYLAGRG
jgi:dienelactone hydrolase